MKKLFFILLFCSLNADLLQKAYTIDKQQTPYRLGKYYPNLQAKRQEILNSCNKGELVSCHNLGYLYANGIGFFKNETRAWQIFAKTCDSDIAISCYNLARIAKSKDLKHDYLKQACRLEDELSCKELAELDLPN